MDILLAVMCSVLIILPATESSTPGTFFWRPRLGLFLTMPRRKGDSGGTVSEPLNKASKDNIYNGTVLLTNRYKMAISILALTEGLQSYSANRKLVYLQPTQPYFYTNAWRWFLRHFDILMDSVANGKPYVNSQQAWRKRFSHLNDRIPKTLQYLMLPFISSKDWAKEEKYHKLYRQYAEPVFSKYYRYPGRHFNNYASDKEAQEPNG